MLEEAGTEASSSSLFDLLATQSARFRELYLQAERDAEEAREREWHAAVRIQSCWRGYTERKALQRLHDAAGTIQRAFRGLMGRKRFRVTVKQQLKDLRTNHYNTMAARIQAVWKGYCERKHGLDYYARKAYLEALRKHNADIKHELDEFEREQAARRQAAQEKAEKKRRLRELERQHVLLSTRAQRGVLAVQEKGQDMEVTVRTVNKLQTLRKPRPPPGPSPRKTASTAAPVDASLLYSKPQGPFKPPEHVVRMKTRAPRVTLKRAEPYLSPVDPSKVFERASDGVAAEEAHQPRFAGFSKTHKREEGHVQSVFASTPYIGEGPGDLRQTYGRQTFRSAEQELNASSSTSNRLAFSTNVGRISLFDETEP
ncbi:hypothetical protein PTSG_04606 [Salpingoeca rosetta]|uniref:Uncharacterized protein n=1 Tax=Salpingoeca rosetta (strain ATCC 50818 / BSB-021) TaxID=946362 RepID=F2U7X2_SALR5|nr:uncharacterized protein PTSG_04606 [Salpingoeca rosetta]EGD72877.1 hypothetical protein PTSG_04606 [Salpingoeca rosetta]|eukprot:XP_004994699.1 hypothetical protein PTSG_04606 [Salpingoeca rosetta]